MRIPTFLPVTLVAALLVACGGGGGPTGTNPGGGGGTNPTPCQWNPAIPATSPLCVAPVPPVAILVRNFGWTTDPVPADSTFVGRAAFRPDLPDPETRWYAAPEVFVRLSNNEVRASTASTFTPLDPSALDVRSAPPGFRAKQDGCTKVQVDAEGLRSWFWVNMKSTGITKCP